MAFTTPSTGPMISPTPVTGPLATSSPQVQPIHGGNSSLHTAPPPPVGQPLPYPTQVQGPPQTQPTSLGQNLPYPNQGAPGQIPPAPAGQSLPYPTQILPQTQAVAPLGQTGPYPTGNASVHTLPPASGGLSVTLSVQGPPAPAGQPLPYPVHGTSVQATQAPPASVGQTLPYPITNTMSVQAPAVGQTLTTYPTQGTHVQAPPPIPPASVGQTLPYPRLASQPQPTPPPPIQQELPYPLQPAPPVDPSPPAVIPSPPCTCAPVVSGAPINMRVSSMRTENMIKVRWQPSFVRPEAAAYYEVEMRLKKTFQVSLPWEWKVVATCNKFSGKATNLQSNTTYEFRVRAMNAEGTPSPYSETITGSTKGGGAVSRGAFSGLSKVANSGSSLFGSSKLKGKNPSGAGATVFGKLSRGMSSAGNYLGNKAKVEEEPVSPQSSDDEL